MSKATPITVAHSDGIGPEIMAASLQILKQKRVIQNGLQIVKTEYLLSFGGHPAYTLAQGQ